MHMARAWPSRRTSQVVTPAGPLLEPLALLKGTLSAFVFSLLLFAVISALVAYTPMTDEHMPLVATITGVFSVLWGGFTAARLASRGAIVHGGLVGLLYGTLVLLLGRFVLQEPTTALMLWRIAGALLCGAVGGAIAPRPKLRRKQ